MRSTRWLLAVSVPVFASLGAQGVPDVRADVWICEDRGGTVTMADRKLKGQRCSIFSRGASGASGGGAPSGGGTSSSWTPRAPGTPLQTREEPSEQREREALYLPWIAQAAEEFDLPAAFIRAVIRVESNFRARAESEKGAMGLMQLMPSVARELGVVEPWEPRANIRGGAALLRRLADRFEGDIVKVLSAYHAGSGAVKAAGGIPWEATEGYVRRVLDHYYAYVDEAAGVVPSAPAEGDADVGDPVPTED